MSIKKLQNLLIFFIFLVFYSGCALNNVEVGPLGFYKADPNWFVTKKRFTHFNYKNSDTKYIIHPFFDLKANLLKKDQGINIIVLTPVGSKFEYGMDLKSGKAYLKRNYCHEDDIWKSYDSRVKTPPFTTGIAPRILDQRGFAQKVIVFGAKEYFPNKDKEHRSSIRVRVVGSVVEQYCPKYPCTKRNKWLSRDVLVAVNPNDPSYQNITEFSSLKSIAPWAEARAFLENASGRNISSVKELPSYRVIGEYNAEEAITRVRKKGHLFKAKEIMSLRKSCHGLYDFLWSRIKSIRKNINRPKLKTKYSSLDTTREEFSEFLYKTSRKFKKRFLLCQKYVRAGSINDNTDRLWFFSYLYAFFALEELGEVYSCKQKSWIDNPFLISNRRAMDPIKKIKGCSTDQLNSAFYKAISSFAARKKSFQDYYRYITYDNVPNGTHHKLYSWVFEDSKYQSCSENKGYPRRIIFPENAPFKSF